MSLEAKGISLKYSIPGNPIEIANIAEIVGSALQEAFPSGLLTQADVKTLRAMRISSRDKIYDDLADLLIQHKTLIINVSTWYSA